MQLQYRSHTFAQEGAGELPHNTIAPTMEDATLRMLMILVVLFSLFARFKGVVFNKRKELVPFPIKKKNKTSKTAAWGGRRSASEMWLAQPPASCVRPRMGISAGGLTYPEGSRGIPT